MVGFKRVRLGKINEVFSSLVTKPTNLGLGFTCDIGLFSSNHSGFWHCLALEIFLQRVTCSNRKLMWKVLHCRYIKTSCMISKGMPCASL